MTLILAVIAAMAVPSLRKYADGRNPPNTAAHIVAMANYGRALAISDGVVVRLNIDPATGRCWLTRQDLNDPAGGFIELGEDMGQVFEAPDGVKLEWDDSARAAAMANSQAAGTGVLLPDPPPAAQPYVDFQPSGRSTPASIRVVGRDGSVIAVTCPSATELFSIVPQNPQASR